MAAKTMVPEFFSDMLAGKHERLCLSFVTL